MGCSETRPRYTECYPVERSMAQAHPRGEDTPALRTHTRLSEDRALLAPSWNPCLWLMQQRELDSASQVASPRTPKTPDRGRSYLETSLATSPTSCGAPTVAEEYAECCVCFDPLCESQCAVLLAGGKRTCRHVLHEHCARSVLEATRECPECRAAFDTVKQLPRLDRSREAMTAWFNAADYVGDGRLSRTEAMQVLKAQYRLDWRSLEQHIGELWVRWDANRSGYIDFEDLCAEGGLLEYVCSEEVARQFRLPHDDRLPPLDDAADWFTFWDDDNNNVLDMAEVQRALIKTFSLGGDLRQVNSMKEALQAAWPMFDANGTGSIEFSEFVMPGGLGEALVAASTSWSTRQGG